MSLPRNLPTIRVGAALVDPELRSALRAATEAELYVMLAAQGANLTPVLDFHERAPLNALVLDVRLLDRAFDVGEFRRRAPHTTFILVGDRSNARHAERTASFDAVVPTSPDAARCVRQILAHIDSPPNPQPGPAPTSRTASPATSRGTTPTAQPAQARAARTRASATPPSSSATTTPPAAPRPTRAPAVPTNRPSIIVLACSTGGPQALATLIPALPADFPVPIAIVQHMPPGFTRQLADRLDKKSNLTVREVTEPVIARPGEVWMAPGDRHIVLANRLRRIELNDGPPENSCRPSADVLFRSAAEFYGGTSLGVVLTGMGDDGTRGARALNEHGASIIVQDKASSVVWGMPGSVSRAGLAGLSVPIDNMAATLIRVCRHQPARTGSAASHSAPHASR